MKKPTVFNRQKAIQASHLAYNGNLIQLKDFLQETIDNHPDSAWAKAFVKFNKWLDNPHNNELPYKIFAKGNGKLPFWAFSVLPLVTCPGAGDCAEWCYSLKAWRYPAPYLRQVMNTILIRFYNHRISEAFDKLPAGTDVRLYVDGDIDSIHTLMFWMDKLYHRPSIKAYGYSKSWELFMEYSDLGFAFPKNYKLNLSSGSIYDSEMKEKMKQLPITRGEFVAVEAGKKPSRKTVGEVARKFGMKKIFVCPGRCGECIKNKNGQKNIHACGSEKLQDTTIVIGTH